MSESTDVAAKCFMHIQNILKRVDQRNIAAETDLTRVQSVVEATGTGTLFTISILPNTYRSGYY